MIQINGLPPFKRMCVSIGNLPSSFMESMSYYEALEWLYKYLSDTIIPTVNTTGEAVTELQNAFITLESYVNNYFDNLDVQNEINNKLDEMAESGELTDIIAQYLGLAGMIAFDTVSDMKSAENLVNGSKCHTLGFSTVNDGGSSLYKIRTITNADVIDEKSIIALHDNTLIAELIPINSTLNLKQIGLTNKADYTSDFSSLADIINLLNIKKVIFNSEIYNVTQPTIFDIDNDIIEFDFNGGTIKLNANIRYFTEGIFTINMDMDKQTECYIHDGSFDGSGTPPSFLKTDTSPNGGRGMFSINGARYIKANNLYFTDWFYSECICSRYCSNADITNITGIRVGGRSATNDEDARGDALYFGFTGVVYDEDEEIDENNSQNVCIKVENCNFSSWDAVENLYPDDPTIRNGCKSGRAGIVFGEYANTPNPKNLIINNCYFNNYQRMIHIENTLNVNIEVNNTTFENYGEVLLLAQNISGDNITFNNCDFVKTVDVIAIHPEYNVIANGHTSNNLKQIIINNSTIHDEYGALMIYGKDINFLINNSYIEMSRMNITNNCHPKFNNCIIKYDRFITYNSIFELENCTLVGGYLNDTSSINFIQSTSGTYYTSENNIINNCKCLNVGTVSGSNKYVIKNSEFTYDNDMKVTDLNNTSRTAFFGFYPDRLQEFSNNILNNGISTIVKFMDETGNSNTACQIFNNKFYNTRLLLYNVTGYKCRIYNNLFINSNEAITSGGDFYNSKAIVNNNIYIGLSAPSNINTPLQFNNYVSADGTSISLIS